MRDGGPPIPAPPRSNLDLAAGLVLKASPRRTFAGHCGPLLIYCFQAVTRRTHHGSRTSTSSGPEGNRHSGRSPKGRRSDLLCGASRASFVVDGQKGSTPLLPPTPAFCVVWYELRACQHYWYNKSEERRSRSWRAFPAGAIFSWRCPLMILSLWAWRSPQRAFQREHALPFTPDSRSQFIPATTRSTTSLKNSAYRARISRANVDGHASLAGIFRMADTHRFHERHSSCLAHMQVDRG